jgi:hypothetical protein
MDAKNVIILFTGIAEIGVGSLFLVNAMTDIQIGFGVVLLAQGIIHLTK